MRVLWLPRARMAREAAIEYVAQDNPSAALEQLGRIEIQVDALLEHPEIGRLGREKGTRELVISRTPFILVYRIAGDVIQVLHFLHGAQVFPSGCRE